MLSTLLDEIATAATASLGTAIQAVATKYGVALTSTFAIETWWQEQKEVNRASYPVLSIMWKGSPDVHLKRVASGVKDAMHGVELDWIHKTTDSAAMEAHLKYLPEAMVNWLSDFPTSTHQAGATIHQIAPPKGEGVSLTPKPINARKGTDGTTTYEYGFTTKFTVRTRETT